MVSHGGFLTMCKPTKPKLDISTEEGKNKLRQYYIDKYNDTWNRCEKLKAGLEHYTSIIDNIDKGIITDAMLNEYNNR